MTITEENVDLFNVGEEYYLVHCISADFALEEGISVEFDKMFDLKKSLNEAFPTYVDFFYKRHCDNLGTYGECILIDNVLSPVTRTRYFDKPTYQAFYSALFSMKKLCKDYHIKKIAIPRYNGGFNVFEWSKVKQAFESVFENMNIDILVCCL